TDWFEVANLWGCIVGRPGALKSPAIHEALKPLHRLEVKASEAYSLVIAEHAKAHQLWEMRKDAAKKIGTKALAKDPNATVEEYTISEPEEPAQRPPCHE